MGAYRYGISLSVQVDISGCEVEQFSDEFQHF